MGKNQSQRKNKEDYGCITKKDVSVYPVGESQVTSFCVSVTFLILS
jgi:hypothetical protein